MSEATIRPATAAAGAYVDDVVMARDFTNSEGDR
jgi:hypothetical protein